jgi:hypothetical protein
MQLCSHACCMPHAASPAPEIIKVRSANDRTSSSTRRSDKIERGGVLEGGVSRSRKNKSCSSKLMGK